jgi:hypothetical protein
VFQSYCYSRFSVEENLGAVPCTYFEFFVQVVRVAVEGKAILSPMKVDAICVTKNNSHSLPVFVLISRLIYDLVTADATKDNQICWNLSLEHRCYEATHVHADTKLSALRSELLTMQKAKAYK